MSASTLAEALTDRRAAIAEAAPAGIDLDRLAADLEAFVEDRPDPPPPPPVGRFSPAHAGDAAAVEIRVAVARCKAVAR